MTINWRKVGVFLALTFAGSWLLAEVFFALGGRLNSWTALPMLIVYMFMPMMMALVVQKGVYKQPVVAPLGVNWRFNWWWVVGWLLPVALALGALGASLLLPEVHYTPDLSGLLEKMRASLPPEQLELAKKQMDSLPVHPFWLALMSALVAGPTVNAVAGFGEELGWRGLLQRELGPLGFWRSSALIGLAWGLWHAPVIARGYNYPQHPGLGVLLMTTFTLLLAPLFSYVRLRAGSVIAAAILHGTLNAAGGLPLMVIKGGDDRTVGVTGLAGLLVLLLVNLVLLLYDRYLARESLLWPRPQLQSGDA